MFNPEAELEVEMEGASESTSDGEDDDDDTTISISDQEEEDVDKLSPDVDYRAREASPVFYIDPDDEWSSSNEEQQDETLKSEDNPGAIKEAKVVTTDNPWQPLVTPGNICEDEDVSLLRSVLCSPLGRMRTVSMMSASPPPSSSQPPRLKRPNSLISRNLEVLAGNSNFIGSPEQQPRSLLRGRMRKTAIPLLGALVRQKRMF